MCVNSAEFCVVGIDCMKSPTHSQWIEDWVTDSTDRSMRGIRHWPQVIFFRFKEKWASILADRPIWPTTSIWRDLWANVTYRPRTRNFGMASCNITSHCRQTGNYRPFDPWTHIDVRSITHFYWLYLQRRATEFGLAIGGFVSTVHHSQFGIGQFRFIDNRISEQS